MQGTPRPESRTSQPPPPPAWMWSPSHLRSRSAGGRSRCAQRREGISRTPAEASVACLIIVRGDRLAGHRNQRAERAGDGARKCASGIQAELQLRTSGIRGGRTSSPSAIFLAPPPVETGSTALRASAPCGKRAVRALRGRGMHAGFRCAEKGPGNPSHQAVDDDVAEQLVLVKNYLLLLSMRFGELGEICARLGTHIGSGATHGSTETTASDTRGHKAMPAPECPSVCHTPASVSLIHYPQRTRIEPVHCIRISVGPSGAEAALGRPAHQPCRST